MNFVKRNYWECYKSKKKTSLFINESLVTINGKLLILLTKNILLPLGVTDAAIQKKKMYGTCLSTLIKQRKK